MDRERFRDWFSRVDELTAAQRKEVAAVLSEPSEDAAALAAIELGVDDERRCPHCGAGGAVKRGNARGLRRIRCKGCGKTFGALTGTALSGLHHKERWLAFGASLAEREENGPPPPPKPKTAIEPVVEKAAFEISWPNVVRIDHCYRPRLSLDLECVRPLELDATRTAQLADMAPIVDGKPDVTKIDSIDLENLACEFRTRRIVFGTARDVFDQMRGDWPGGRTYLLAQLVRLVEQFIRSDKIDTAPALFLDDDLKRRLIVTLNMTRVVQHIWEAIRHENTERMEPEFDRDRPIRTTSDMRTWYTGKPCEYTARSHVSFCVFDSTWEASEAFALDRAPEAAAWVKNDHLGFEVFYVHRGVVRKYRPDFLIRLVSGDMLVLETKGRDSDQDRPKRRFLAEWFEAVNAHGGFGHWSWDVSKAPADIRNILARHMGVNGA